MVYIIIESHMVVLSSTVCLNSSISFFHFSSGIHVIQTGIGYSMSVVVQDFTLFLSAFVVAFVVNWKLASVISTLLPVMCIMFYIIEKVIVYI